MWPFNRKKKKEEKKPVKTSRPRYPSSGVHPDNGSTLMNYMILDSMTHEHHKSEPDPIKHYSIGHGGEFGGGGSTESYDSHSHSSSDSSSYDSGSSYDSSDSSSSDFSSND